jgi:hypothetical protein
MFKMSGVLRQHQSDQESLAFQSLSSYSIESPIGLLELEYGIILGPFLEDLLRLYFQNIHPYYPVVDEYDFDASFSYTLDNAALRRSRATVLGAMLLCASMVFKRNNTRTLN